MRGAVDRVGCRGQLQPQHMKTHKGVSEEGSRRVERDLRRTPMVKKVWCDA